MRRIALASKTTIAICLLGVLLHAYTVLFKAGGGTPYFGGILFLIGLFLWSCLPYVIWAVVALARNQSAPAVGAAIATLAFDCYAYYGVFVAPTGSTAALALLFTPLWNLILFGPIGAAVSWPLLHIATKRRQN